MTDKITIVPCGRESISKIVDGINQYNLDRVPALSDIWTPLEYIAKNENGEEIGGVLAGIGYWNGLEINIIWVKDEYRKKGIGSHILKYVEDIAKAKGATVAMLDTFDFQAEEFYLRNGYISIGEIQNFPKGHKRIYFSKRLDL
ncbi:GNAT family N-acetyltransferase [Pedobacter sp. 22163]|uniref:GNAT family N-acetyltransferase n=1 Tax=Pedobacter sp. 22163 TaxID=3453883 RepID=UPI003F83FE69